MRPQEGGHDHQPGARSARDVGDPSPGNNSASATTTVTPVADLSLTKSDSPDPVLAGELLTYTLTAHNAGPSSASGVELIDTLPAGVTFDSATPTQGSCSEASGTVTCALGTIADGAAAPASTVKIRATAPGHDHEPGRRRVRRQRPDPRRTTPPAPRRRSTAAADLSLTKTRLAGPGAGGRAAHLHPHGPQRGPAGRDRTSSSPTRCRPA